MAGSKNYYRQRTCDCCGKIEQVRKDNKAATCGNCSRRLRIAHASAVREARRERTRVYRSCAICGTRFHVAGGRKECCSVDCKRALQAARRVDRKCKHCGNLFAVAPGRLSGKTNSSANYCSTACYHNFLANEERTKSYGPRWKKVRGTAKDAAPFCALCGTFKQIDMHHIVPYRISQDNRHLNLIGLCKRHHKRVELLTQEIVASGENTDRMWMVLHTMLSELQEATFQKLKSLGYRKNYEPRISI